MSFDCASMRELLPEYAVGALDGRDRATIEAHLQTCSDCRAEADAFLEIADSVLGLAPLAEPPVGFEARVLQRLVPPRRRTRRPRALLAAAALLVAALGVGIGVGRLSAPPPQIRTAALRAKGSYVGKAWIHTGDPGWIYVDMHYADADQTISLEVVDARGHTQPAGELQLAGGHGTLGVRSPVPVARVAKIRMREADGTLVCQAVLS